MNTKGGRSGGGVANKFGGCIITSSSLSPSHHVFTLCYPQKLQEDDFRETEPNDGAAANNNAPAAPTAAPAPETTPDSDDTGPKPPRLLFTTIEKSKFLDNDDDDDDTASVDEDEERLQIRVPADAGGGGYRWVLGQCTICLCRYRPGVVVARSSSCPHVFHSACIETWLLRQDDPVCPCCRRDFLVDPYDVAESGMGADEAEKDESQNRQDEAEVEDGEDDHEETTAMVAAAATSASMEEGTAATGDHGLDNSSESSSPPPLGTTTVSDAACPSDPPSPPPPTTHASI